MSLNGDNGWWYSGVRQSAVVLRTDRGPTIRVSWSGDRRWSNRSEDLTATATRLAERPGPVCRSLDGSSCHDRTSRPYRAWSATKSSKGCLPLAWNVRSLGIRWGMAINTYLTHNFFNCGQLATTECRRPLRSLNEICTKVCFGCNVVSRLRACRLVYRPNVRPACTSTHRGWYRAVDVGRNVLDWARI